MSGGAANRTIDIAGSDIAPTAALCAAHRFGRAARSARSGMCLNARA
jgi:hypothetical protein